MPDDKVKTDELPSISEEETKVEESKETPSMDIDALVAELERAGVTNPKELEGKLIASREAGNLANQLGAARNEIQSLKEEVLSMRGTTRRKQDDYYDDDTTPGNADLKSLVREAMREEKKAELIQQQKAREQAMQMHKSIREDEHFSLVKDIWEQKERDSDFLWKVQNGMINPVDEYHKTVVAFYKGLAKRSVETINTLKGGKPAAAAPHVEDGARVSHIETKDEETPEEKRLKELKAKSMLTEEEELEAVQLALLASK